MSQAKRLPGMFLPLRKCRPPTDLRFLSDGCLYGPVGRKILHLITQALLALCVSAFPCWGQSSVSDADIRAAIGKLASTSDSESPNTHFQVLYKNPERSTELLIAALKPAPRGKYLSGHHPQAVWIVRALRSLTGLDFRATTAAELSRDEAHFLDLNAQQQVLFFGTWMSRDSVWVAPKDAQIVIIKQWRDWFLQHGHNHKYVNDTNFDHWYF
jgi:hypothetical protein